MHGGGGTGVAKKRKKSGQLEQGRALNEKEVHFIVALIMSWIERQINEKWDSAV